MFSSQPAVPDYTVVSPFDLGRMLRIAALQYKEYQAKNGLKMDLREIYKLDLIMETPRVPHTHYDLRFFKNKILHDHMAGFLDQHKIIRFYSEDPETLEKYFFLFKGKIENHKLNSNDELEFLRRLGGALQVDWKGLAKLPENQSEKLRVSFK